MSWMRTEFFFGGNVATITVSDHRYMIGLRDVVRDHQNEPEKLAARIEQFIELVRQDLIGVKVQAIHLTYDPVRWSLTCWHPSFPRVADFTPIPVRPLEICAHCRGDLVRMAMRWEGPGGLMFCSQECLNSRMGDQPVTVKGGR